MASPAGRGSGAGGVHGQRRSETRRGGPGRPCAPAALSGEGKGLSQVHPAAAQHSLDSRGFFVDSVSVFFTSNICRGRKCCNIVTTHSSGGRNFLTQPPRSAEIQASQQRDPAGAVLPAVFQLPPLDDARLGGGGPPFGSAPGIFSKSDTRSRILDALLRRVYYYFCAQVCLK